MVPTVLFQTRRCAPRGGCVWQNIGLDVSPSGGNLSACDIPLADLPNKPNVPYLVHPFDGVAPKSFKARPVTRTLLAG
jgi:hypothetical protein